MRNSRLYDYLEGAFSVDRIQQFGQYSTANANFVHSSINDKGVKMCVESIRGSLVMWPMNFLKDEDLSPSMATKVLVPTPLWV